MLLGGATVVVLIHGASQNHGLFLLGLHRDASILRKRGALLLLFVAGPAKPEHGLPPLTSFLAAAICCPNEVQRSC